MKKLMIDKVCRNERYLYKKIDRDRDVVLLMLSMQCVHT